MDSQAAAATNAGVTFQQTPFDGQAPEVWICPISGLDLLDDLKLFHLWTRSFFNLLHFCTEFHRIHRSRQICPRP